MVDIFKASLIDGWMHTAELVWLAEQAQKHKVIVEIGSFLGRSTRALADHTPGRVYAIDDWYGPTDANVNIPEDIRAKLFDQFERNLLDVRNKVLAICADHGDEKSIDICERPDMVFIDGGHEYDDVARDIKFWYKKAAPGALICGHDYDKGFPGVQKAVNEYFPKVEVFGSIWFCEKKFPFDSAKGN